jgi:arsenite methyltransferase
MTTSYSHDSTQLAETYDRISDSQLEGGRRLVERLAIHAGDSVLDVGCGTGRLARHIAHVVGAGGRVVGIDPLAERVALARTRAGAGIAFEVGQAEDLGAFAEASFDAVCMSAVFHWVNDKPRALREIRRVLRPGGRTGLTTLAREMMHAGTIIGTIVPVLTEPPYVSCVDLSGLALATKGPSTTELVAMLGDAQLELVELHVVERVRTHTTGHDVVEFLEASAFGNFLRIVPDDLRASLRADLASAFDALRGPDGIAVRDWGTLLVARKA